MNSTERMLTLNALSNAATALETARREIRKARILHKMQTDQDLMLTQSTMDELTTQIDEYNLQHALLMDEHVAERDGVRG